MLKHDFYDDLEKRIVNFAPAPFARQRMTVNKKTGLMYLYEQDNGTDKNFSKITEWEPNTGKFRSIPLPCMAEDICFDLDGLIYLRVDQGVIRFDMNNWKEVPWDYGNEYQSVRFQSTNGGKATTGISVLPVNGGRTNPFWHLGGMEISAKGHLAVATYNSNTGRKKDNPNYKSTFSNGKQAYTPTLFPGRFVWGEIHVFDKYGKLIRDDAFPGAGHMNGLGIDKNDNLYVLLGATRLNKGKKYDDIFNDVTDTLVKTNKNTKVLSDSTAIPVVIPIDERPKRAADVESGNLGVGGRAWVQDAEWLYGGVGSTYSNQPAPSCTCWNTRFTLDLLGRSFAPEIRHCSVAVLDTAGNLILRIGQYGNIDEGVPLISDPDFGKPSSIGGDEVSIFYAPYVTTETDKRLYIADSGNTRIISVKLNYEKDEIFLLKDYKEEKK